ncbi:hypothetical protein GOV12_02565 [Candidatus Pacearchaeota archaeon]|nr:hypothetical protein [Candidatus Pacearchaeota archaeon]
MEYCFFKINRNKKSQITIFIILALIIVVLILLVFVGLRPPIVISHDEKSPQIFIESCTKEILEKTLDKIRLHGGVVDPELNVLYGGEKRTYLCYTNKDYNKCVNQKPKLIESIEEEITLDITNDINRCFETLKLNLEKSYEIDMSGMKIKSELKPKEVVITINRGFKMTKGDDVREFDMFKIGMIDPMYELALVSMEIVNQEAQYCNFDNLGYMIIYPEYDISRIKTGDSDTIYRVGDRMTKKDFNFAVRSCVLPAGI